jgi:formate/nitrite transporter FocA (FNT family)
MFLAVESFRRKEQLHAIVRTVLLFLCVAIFILSGFEHCIANMYYFSVAGKWSAAALMNILLMTAGNSAGGFLLPLLADIKKP